MKAVVDAGPLIALGKLGLLGLLHLGLMVKGTLGVIVEASRRGLMTAEEVEIVFQAILDRGDIWISDGLVHRVRDAWRAEDWTRR